jgi:hypothetical protein
VEVKHLREALAPGGSGSEVAAKALTAARGAADALVDRVTAADYAGELQQLWASPPAIELREGVTSAAAGVKAATEGLAQTLADVDVAAQAQRVRGAATPAFDAALASAGVASAQLQAAAADLASQIQRVDVVTAVAGAQDRFSVISGTAASGVGAAAAELETFARGAMHNVGEAAAGVDVKAAQQQLQTAAAAFATSIDAARSRAAAAAGPSASALQASAAEAAMHLETAMRRAAEALGHGTGLPSGERSLDVPGLAEKGAEEFIWRASRLVGRVW